jgi:hypothetical protein
MEQEVCQLLLAALCRKTDGSGSALPFWQKKWQKKATGSDANGFLRGLVD